MNKIRRYHTWNMLPYKERSLLHVFETLQITATNQGLDAGILDLSKEYYVALTEHCQKRGLSRSAILASCVFSALKQAGQPRKPKDVADMFHLQNAQFTKAFKDFQCILAMAKQKGLISQNSIIPSQLRTTRASDYIAYPLSKLSIQRSELESLRDISIQIADKAESDELSKENMPSSLASAVIAFVLQRCGYGITTDVIAVACDVSEGTLVKCLRRLEQSEAILIEFIPKQKRKAK
jgi:transcription initiation factor TFIIIB Brf1 subunit/transcription initiation factor TFIIB